MDSSSFLRLSSSVELTNVVPRKRLVFLFYFYSLSLISFINTSYRWSIPATMLPTDGRNMPLTKVMTEGQM